MFWSSKKFELSDIPDLSGKIAIVTGSSTGIGKECALALAQKNCTVIIAARSVERSHAVVDEIKADTGNDNVEYIPLDLASLKSVKQFVATFTEKYKDLHILLNNAGGVRYKFTLTEDGLETQFETNYLSPYYLTILLLPLLEKSAPSRIVNVSSVAHSLGSLFGINYSTLHNANRQYFGFLEYSKTKAANILFTHELAKRLKNKGINNVYVNSNHPGNIATDGSRDVVGFIAPLFFDPPKIGALTQLYLATSPEVEEKNITGQYYVPTAKPSKPSGYCQSDANATELWDYSEKLLKEKVPDYQGAMI